MAFKIGIDLDVTFDGDYINPEDAEYHLENWLWSAFEDRDDVAGVHMVFGPVRMEK